MAWRNIEIATLIGIPQSTITDLSLCDLSSVPNANTMPNYVSWNGTQGSGISTGKFFGDNSDYCEITKPQAALIFKFYRNGADIGIGQSQTVGNNLISFVAAVDDATGKAYFLVLYKDSRYSWIGAGSGNRPPFGSATMADMYYILTHNEYIAHIWHSWPSVTGKNGTFNFTMLKDENINLDGSMTNFQTGDFSKFSGQTLLSSLLENVPVGVETPAIYAGRVDYLSVTRGAVSPGVLPTLTVKIYYNNTVIKTITTTTNGYISFIVDNENQIARVSLVKPYDSAGITRYDASGFITDSDSAELYNWLNAHSPEPEVNEPEGDGDTDPWNDIGISGLTEPTASGVATGFTSMYQVSAAQLKSLAAYLWSDNFFDNVTKFFDDPREILIGISLMPIEPNTGTAKNISAGGVDTGIQGLPLTSQYKTVPMGSIAIKEEKTAKFLNFPPNTRIFANLPYVGCHELNVHDIMGKTLTLTYLFDFLNGCCVAELAISGGTKTHRYFYSGSCAVQIPTSAEDFGRQYSAILSSGVAFGSALAAPFTGGLTAPMAIGALGNTLNNGMAMSPNVEYSSGGGAITGFLSSQTAYLVVELPNEKIADSQKNFIGRPSFMTKTLSSVSGFAKCMDAHVKNIPCTGKEKDEIEANLKAGVLIEAGSPTPTVTPTVAGNTVLAFMNMKSENNVIGKTWDRGTDENAILKIEGKQIFDQSILTPKFLISGDLRGYNYCYIELFGRFYYVTDIVAKSGNLMEVSLKCDPLQSFKTQILNCSAVIERAGSDSLINSYFNDGMYWTQANKTVKFIPFLNDEGDELTIPRNANSYILTIAGGD